MWLGLPLFVTTLSERLKGTLVTGLVDVGDLEGLFSLVTMLLSEGPLLLTAPGFVFPDFSSVVGGVRDSTSSGGLFVCFSACSPPWLSLSSVCISVSTKDC